MTTETLLRIKYNRSFEFITFKIRISKYTEYLLILDQIRHEQNLDRDSNGLNWSSHLAASFSASFLYQYCAKASSS